MALVKLSIWLEPAEVPGDEIPILQGQGLYEYTVGGADDPNKSAPSKAAPAPHAKEK
jgi:hypothetical protein